MSDKACDTPRAAHVGRLPAGPCLRDLGPAPARRGQRGILPCQIRKAFTGHAHPGAAMMLAISVCEVVEIATQQLLVSFQQRTELPRTAVVPGPGAPGHPHRRRRIGARRSFARRRQPRQPDRSAPRGRERSDPPGQEAAALQPSTSGDVRDRWACRRSQPRRLSCVPSERDQRVQWNTRSLT